MLHIRHGSRAGARWGYRRLLAQLGWAACLLSTAAAAQPVEDLTVHGEHLPLQEVIRKKRARGPVFVSVPTAYTFGMGGKAGTEDYCSPSIRMSNSSNRTVQELIVGIEFRMQDGGKAAGTTVTHMFSLEVGEQDTHYFYRLDRRECSGLVGEMTVVRCTYDHGGDCGPDVQAIGFGAIPLKRKP